MDTFLPPIEHPLGLVKKLAYYFTRRQFGKVPTPVKVHSARLPSAFGLFYAKIGKLDQKLTLPQETVLLIREQVARHYSEREICEIVWLVTSEHVYNITNLGLNIHSDLLGDLSRKQRSSSGDTAKG